MIECKIGNETWRFPSFKETIEKNRQIEETLRLINYQGVEPFCNCPSVGAILQEVPDVAFWSMFRMFMLGYIEGKRADRARRKGGRL